MRVDDFYLQHPKIAFSIQTVTACVLGYVTHLIQQRWYRENYLLLHISIWWVLILLILLYFAERIGRRATPEQLARNQWADHFRLNVLFHGSAEWFTDPPAENLNDGMPKGGPLFRSICLRMPGRWQLDQFVTSLTHGTQSATFGRGKSPIFEIGFDEWAIGWCIGVMHLRNAAQDDVHDFLEDLHRVIETTTGISSLRWYHDEMLAGGQMTESDYELGTPTPVESARVKP